MKHVLIITYEFPPFLGGAGHYGSNLATGLAKCNNNVDIITYHQENREFSHLVKSFKKEFNINIFSIKSRKYIHFIQFYFLIKKKCDQNNYDSIIINDSRAKKVFAFFSFKLKKYYPKSICIIHGQEINQFFKKPKKFLLLLNIKKIMLSFFSSLKYIINVSKNEYELWKTEFPELSKKLRMVNSGVNTSVYYKRSPKEILAIKNELNIPKDKIIIMSASRLTKQKGQDNLIKAFNKLKEDRNDLYLIICGCGPYEKTLKAKVRALGLETSILFTGKLNSNELSRYYAISDIFALISRYEEAFGLVYLEAAACDTSIIAGNLGGITDIIINDKTGLIANSHEYLSVYKKLKILVENPKIAKSLRANAYEFCEQNFTNVIMGNKIEKLIYLK